MSNQENQKTDNPIEKREAELPEGVENTRAGREYLPRTDIYETEDQVVIVADMPGVGADGIDLTLERNLLTLRGRVAPDEPADSSYAWREYEVGDFVRSFKLSSEVDRDNIKATAKNGVLTLSMKKLGPQRQQIEVNEG
jgi:HSP20 family molecular chaperone IbpA